MRPRLVLFGLLALLLLIAAAPFFEVVAQLLLLLVVLLVAASVGQSIAKAPRWLLVLWFLGAGRDGR